MFGNLICVQYSDGKWIWGQEITTLAISASFGILEFGFSENGFREFGGTLEDGSWYWINKEKDSWTIFSAAAYFIGGGSFSIGFDLNTFLHEMNQIIESYK